MCVKAPAEVPGINNCHAMTAAVSDTDTVVDAAFTAVANGCSKQPEIVDISDVDPCFVLQDSVLVLAQYEPII